MIKSVTFAEYLEAEKNNVGKSEKEIFNIAWKTSKQGKEYYEKRNKMLKTFAIGGVVCLGILSFSGLGTIKAFADVRGMETLRIESPFLASKLKSATDFYYKCIEIFGAENNEPLFISILEKVLNEVEIGKLADAAKDLEFEELLRIASGF